MIQVPTGKEAALCAVIERVAGPGELSECFVPSFETQRKVRGAWETVRAVLFPGYVVAVTRNVGALKQRLRGVSEFTRLLTMGSPSCRWTMRTARGFPPSRPRTTAPSP